MTDRELMQQALNKLEFFAQMKSVSEDTTVLITALRDRLKPPRQAKFNCTVVDDDHPEGVPLSQWGKQQKQEPFCYHDGRNTVGKEYADHSDVFPLYTRPIQQPLTDEQIDKLPWGLHEGNPMTFAEGLRDFARAIEAAHGIKGEKTDAA